MLTTPSKQVSNQTATKKKNNLNLYDVDSKHKQLDGK